jgi:Ser/Thr protein kinase RdoA (MazF antagonist)
LLARLHRSDWPRASPEEGEKLKTQRSNLLGRAKESLDSTDVRFIRQVTSALVRPAIPMTVPCHGDYAPRNWVVDGEGTVRVIDFGQAERDLAVKDFLQLARRDWVGKPELREAFFEGYGRQLTPHEQAQLDGFITSLVAMKLIRALKSGNPPMISRARRAFDAVKRAETTSHRRQPPADSP